MIDSLFFTVFHRGSIPKSVEVSFIARLHIQSSPIAVIRPRDASQHATSQWNVIDEDADLRFVFTGHLRNPPLSAITVPLRSAAPATSRSPHRAAGPPWPKVRLVTVSQLFSKSAHNGFHRQAVWVMKRLMIILPQCIQCSRSVNT